MKSKDNKSVQTTQFTQEVPQLPMKNAVPYVKQLKETTCKDWFPAWNITALQARRAHSLQHGSIFSKKTASAIYF